MPVGAYGASSEIMSHISPEGGVYQAGTLSGNPVAMAAGIAQLSECIKPGFYDELNLKTTAFVTAINNSDEAKRVQLKIFSIESVFWMAFTDKESIRCSSDINPESMKKFNKLYHYLLEEGIYFGPSGYEVGFVSLAHTPKDLKLAEEKIIRALNRLN
jgi:glutamate-1-semialdehyde 2,1-aminomutase